MIPVGGASAAEVAIVDGFGDADPNIQETEAGDDAADGTVIQDGGEGGVRPDKEIVVPNAAPPGKHGNEHAEVDAEQDEHEQGEPLEPDGCGLVGSTRGVFEPALCVRTVGLTHMRLGVWKEF